MFLIELNHFFFVPNTVSTLNTVRKNELITPVTTSRRVGVEKPCVYRESRFGDDYNRSGHIVNTHRYIAVAGQRRDVRTRRRTRYHAHARTRVSARRVKIRGGGRGGNGLEHANNDDKTDMLRISSYCCRRVAATISRRITYIPTRARCFFLKIFFIATRA